MISDVLELEKGMEAVRKEADLRGKGPQNHVLKDFLNNSEEKLKKIKTDCKNAQVNFKKEEISPILVIIKVILVKFRPYRCLLKNIYILI